MLARVVIFPLSLVLLSPGCIRDPLVEANETGTETGDASDTNADSNSESVGDSNSESNGDGDGDGDDDWGEYGDGDGDGDGDGEGDGDGDGDGDGGDGDSGDGDTTDSGDGDTTDSGDGDTTDSGDGDTTDTGDGDGDGDGDTTDTGDGDLCTALLLDGDNDHATMGAAPSLNLAEFTIEAWIYQTGAGDTTASGQSALNPIVPIVTKGRTGADAGNDDVTYFLGIQPDGRLGADFESQNGANHIVEGSTMLSQDQWHHVAMTYDGANFKLFVNGVEDGSEAYDDDPTDQSESHFGVGTSFNPQGDAAGAFEGRIDEVRVWDFARSGGDISSTMGMSVTTGSGLIASYPFEENNGGPADATGSVDGSLGGGAGYFDPGATCLP